MSVPKRHGNKWTINEILSLQREYELLELSIDEIAKRHHRTPEAIMNKLDNEGFADYNELYSNYNNLQNNLDMAIYEADSENENQQESLNLTQRVWGLETSVKEIGTIVKELFNKFVEKESSNCVSVM